LDILLLGKKYSVENKSYPTPSPLVATTAKDKNKLIGSMQRQGKRKKQVKLVSTDKLCGHLALLHLFGAVGPAVSCLSLIMPLLLSWGTDEKTRIRVLLYIYQ